jgi:hypothetical protein
MLEICVDVYCTLLRADIYVLISLSCQSKREIKSPPKTPTPNRNQEKVIVVYPRR